MPTTRKTTPMRKKSPDRRDNPLLRVLAAACAVIASYIFPIVLTFTDNTDTSLDTGAISNKLSEQILRAQAL